MAARTATQAWLVLALVMGPAALPAVAQAPIPVPTPRPDPPGAPADTQSVPTPTPRPDETSGDSQAIPTPSPRPDNEPQSNAQTNAQANARAEAPTRSLGDGVSARFDVVYTRPENSQSTDPQAAPLTLDLYVPRPHSPSLPLVLFLHGGDWNSGDSRHAVPFADLPKSLGALAAKGYVVASVNYRLSGKAPFPAALQDVKTAIRWLRGHAASYGGDGTRLAVWGISAGGQLAAMAGVSCGVPSFEPPGDITPDTPNDCAEAVIDWYAPVELQSLAGDDGQSDDGAVEGAVARYLGCAPKDCAPAVVRQSSPLTFITVHAPPFLIQQGAQDVLVSPKQSRKLEAALTNAGVPAELVLYPDVGHDFARDGAPDAAVVSKAMAKLTDFLAVNFPNKPLNKPAAKTPAPRRK